MTTSQVSPWELQTSKYNFWLCILVFQSQVFCSSKTCFYSHVANPGSWYQMLSQRLEGCTIMSTLYSAGVHVRQALHQLRCILALIQFENIFFFLILGTTCFLFSYCPLFLSLIFPFVSLFALTPSAERLANCIWLLPFLTYAFEVLNVPACFTPARTTSFDIKYL